MKNNELSRELARLANIVERMTPPIPAIPQIPQIPQIPAIPPLPQYSGDHDLLVKLDANVATLTIDVKKLGEKEDTHVTILEFNDHTRANSKAHDDFETRMREISTRQIQILTIGSGLIILMTAIQVWLKLAGH